MEAHRWHWAQWPSAALRWATQLRALCLYALCVRVFLSGLTTREGPVAVAHFKQAARSQWLLQPLSFGVTIFTAAELLPAEVLQPGSMFSREKTTGAVFALVLILCNVKRRNLAATSSTVWDSKRKKIYTKGKWGKAVSPLILHFHHNSACWVEVLFSMQLQWWALRHTVCVCLFLCI